MAALFSDALGKGHVRLRAGKPVRIAIEMVCQPGLYHVLRFGNRPPAPPDLLDVPGSDTGCGDRLSASPRSRLRSGR
jgi:hypothetical protein